MSIRRLLSGIVLILAVGCHGTDTGILEDSDTCEVQNTWKKAFSSKGEVVVRTLKDKRVYWTAKQVGPMTWEEADRYCKGLALEGRKWRLPKKSEGLGLLNPSCQTHDDCYLPQEISGCKPFWTATVQEISYKNKAKYKEAYIVDPVFGGGGFDYLTETHWVLCFSKD